MGRARVMLVQVKRQATPERLITSDRILEKAFLEISWQVRP